MPRKTDQETADAIRSAVEGGMSVDAAAKKYGVHSNTARRIVKGKDHMEMSEAEIRRNYCEAKDKRAQVQILADLNATTRDEIERILAKTSGSSPAEPAASSTPRGIRTTAKSGTKMQELLECSEAIAMALKSIAGGGAGCARLHTTIDGVTINIEMEVKENG